jgi:hypothetical protein
MLTRLVLALSMTLTLPLQAAESPFVEVVLPNHGVQPQALVDSKGVLHVLFLAGEPTACDLFHCTLDAMTRQLTEPQRINHDSGNAIAVGTIRGVQAAIGRDDRLHLVWNGGVMDAQGKRSANVFYTHSIAEGFAVERRLMQRGMHLDGGASVAATPQGRVCAMWHAAPLDTPKGSGEQARRVYVSESADNGATFTDERIVSAATDGVCACCSLRIQSAADGGFHALYRHASGESRAMQWLHCEAKGEFTRQEVQAWKINACPMSSSFILPTGDAMLAAWETESAIWMQRLEADSAAPQKISDKNSKHPCLARNKRDETLITWAIGTGWQRGGTLAWSLLASDGKEIATSGKTHTKVPMWSYPATAHVVGIGFVVIH